MANFVLYIIVGLVACSNFAYAGGWHDACPLEKQTLSDSISGKQFQDIKGHVPSCFEEILEKFWAVDWSCAKKIRSNMISCRNHFKGNDLEGSMEKCMGADWGCHKDCYKKIVKFYDENEGEIKKCGEEFIEAFMIVGKKYKKEFLKAMEIFQLTDGCKCGIVKHWRERIEEAGYDTCNLIM